MFLLLYFLVYDKDRNGRKAFTCSCSAVTQTSISFILMYKTKGLFSMNMIHDGVFGLIDLYFSRMTKKEKIL